MILSSIWRLVEHQKEIDDFDISSIKFKNLNKKNTWLFIWKVREKLFDTSEQIKIEDRNIQYVIKLLKSATINKKRKFNNIEELIHYILGLKFTDIDNYFLNNETWKKEFLIWIKSFLDSEINKLQAHNIDKIKSKIIDIINWRKKD